MLDEYTAEEWRDAPGFEGYYSVSSLGRVRRDRAGNRTRPGQLRKLTLGQRGYCQMVLSRDGIRYNVDVHVLIAGAFLGPRPDGQCVNHLDATKTNNRATNLEYTTPQKNSEHASKHGLYEFAGKHMHQIRGESHHLAKLTPATVCAILAEPDTGRGFQLAMARKYHVDPSTIRSVRLRETWGHVHCPSTTSASSNSA